MRIKKFFGLITRFPYMDTPTIRLYLFVSLRKILFYFSFHFIEFLFNLFLRTSFLGLYIFQSMFTATCIFHFIVLKYSVHISPLFDFFTIVNVKDSTKIVPKLFTFFFYVNVFSPYFFFTFVSMCLFNLLEKLKLSCRYHSSNLT